MSQSTTVQPLSATLRCDGGAHLWIDNAEWCQCGKHKRHAPNVNIVGSVELFPLPSTPPGSPGAAEPTDEIDMDEVRHVAAGNPAHFTTKLAREILRLESRVSAAEAERTEATR